MWFAEGLVSDIASVIVLLGVGWIVVRATGRKRAKAFFGIDRELVVYCSNLAVRGALDHRGTVRSYQGGALAENEMECVLALQRFVGRLRTNWWAVTGPLSRIGLSWNDASVTFHPCPADWRTVRRSGALVTMGSPGYNSLSGQIEREQPNLAVFVNDNTGIAIEDGSASSSEPGTFLLERCVDRARGSRVFYAAGVHQVGTSAAVTYLLNHWQELDGLFGRDETFALLGVTGGDGTTKIVHTVPGGRTVTKGWSSFLPTSRAW
jgi:hypothetical protein